MTLTAPINPSLDVNGGTPGASLLAMNGAVDPAPPPRPATATQTDRGGGEAFEGWIAKVIDRDGPGILRMLWRILGSEQDVIDAYQDCFCNLMSRGDARPPNNARAYAYRTAMNIATELIRGRSRRAAHRPAIQRAAVQQTDTTASSGASGDMPYQISRLREAVASLPPHLQHVVVLRDLSSFSYKQVGRTLGINPATARVYRRHAVVKLAELMGAGGTI